MTCTSFLPLAAVIAFAWSAGTLAAAEKCVIRNEDRCDIPLQWGAASTSQLAGKNVRLRFFLRSANLYAVTAGTNP